MTIQSRFARLCLLHSGVAIGVAGTPFLPSVALDSPSPRPQAEGLKNSEVLGDVIYLKTNLVPAEAACFRGQGLLIFKDDSVALMMPTAEGEEGRRSVIVGGPSRRVPDSLGVTIVSKDCRYEITVQRVLSPAPAAPR